MTLIQINPQLAFPVGDRRPLSDVERFVFVTRFFPRSYSRMGLSLFMNDRKVLVAVAPDGLEFRVDWNVSMPLCRMLQAPYGDEFFSTGSFKIGSLYEYAFGDLEADGRIDRDEGIYYRNDIEENSDIASIVPSLGQWTCCLSKTDDPNLRKKMGLQGLVIDDLGFFFEITRSLEQELGMKIRNPTVSAITYVQKGPTADELKFGALSALKKSPGPDGIYAQQQEVRVLWERLNPTRHTISENTREALMAYKLAQADECPIKYPHVLQARQYAYPLPPLCVAARTF